MCYRARTMAESFTAQVHEIVRRNSRLMAMVAQEATQDLITATQTPRGKGGKMPVDTGFLRASGRMSLTGVPSGPVRPAVKAAPKIKGLRGAAKRSHEKKRSQMYSAPDTVSLGGFKLGMSIFWGWTAIYARRQELYNGFLSSNVRNWQGFVDGAVRKLRDKLR